VKFSLGCKPKRMEDEKKKGNIKKRKVIKLMTNDGFG
jgi:hypothetical protein